MAGRTLDPGAVLTTALGSAAGLCDGYSPLLSSLCFNHHQKGDLNGVLVRAETYQKGALLEGPVLFSKVLCNGLLSRKSCFGSV